MDEVDTPAAARQPAEGSNAAAGRLVDLHARIAGAIASADAAWWAQHRDQLATELYEAQRAAVPAYDAWCAHELTSRTASRRAAGVGRLADVPALPIGAFKQLHVAAMGLPDAACWESSGTSGEAPSRHHLHALGCYDAALDGGVARALLPDVAAGTRAPLRCVQLQPDAGAAPTSSLTHMFDRIRTGAWCRDAGAWVDGRYRVDASGAWRELDASVQAGEPVLILATSFALAMLLERCDAVPALRLPPGSRIVDTGGFKGRTRELTRDELLAQVCDRLGVAPEWCENEYGMSELASQAWLGTVAASAGHSLGTSPRWTPPWLVVRVVDPATLAEVGDGEQGLLVFHDLANVWSCAAVRSEDVGVRRGSSFELVGRADGALLKGCSLRLEQVSRQGWTAGGAGTSQR